MKISARDLAVSYCNTVCTNKYVLIFRAPDSNAKDLHGHSIMKTFGNVERQFCSDIIFFWQKLCVGKLLRNFVHRFTCIKL